MPTTQAQPATPPRISFTSAGAVRRRPPVNQSPADALAALAAEYAPYDTHEAFGEGFVAHQRGEYRNPYDGRTDGRGQVAAQAWDRGLECAARYSRLGHEADAPAVPPRHPAPNLDRLADALIAGDVGAALRALVA
ncbi:hypothetical protein A33M_2905 [Rhodovulum sp. PH10]|uniref:hypothetical protein n=1 Tax=Rhodovulum sp. PH10 TaxID=1187851 RepID=UPI00027C2B41|nr:hypothetical protein [Rhodovulum sp. PH10]EJW11708.1 hypothetical protein A33M_2905 [Rhodovulum sp. PH10]